MTSYCRDGVEALHQDPRQQGIEWNGMVAPRHPCGGRCDIGPEYGGLERDPLWLGTWTVGQTGERSARMESPVLPGAGVQLVREFQLDSTSSHLRFRQVILNHGPAPVRAFHWGRTFAPAGGIAFAPLTRPGRFPRGYATIAPAGNSNFFPDCDPAISICDGVLVVRPSPRHPKLAFDVDPGWLAYVAPSQLLFVKRFAANPSWACGEPMANNASFWYSGPESVPDWPAGGHVVEIEPIGPLEILQPGCEASFSEDWHLERWTGPADANAVRQRAESLPMSEAGRIAGRPMSPERLGGMAVTGGREPRDRVTVATAPISAGVPKAPGLLAPAMKFGSNTPRFA